MAPENLWLTAAQIVNLDKAVLAGNCKAATGRIERYLIDTGLSRDGPRGCLLASGLPDADHTVVASRGNPLAIGAVGNRMNRESADTRAKLELAVRDFVYVEVTVG